MSQNREIEFAAKMIQILSYLRIFELKKWAISEFWHVIDI